MGGRDSKGGDLLALNLGHFNNVFTLILAPGLAGRKIGKVRVFLPQCLCLFGVSSTSCVSLNPWVASAMT